MVIVVKLSPVEYTEATLRNKGLAKFDTKGNVVVGDGKPWIGGTPFPEPKSGVELFANITLTWGRHDVSFYPIKSYEQDKNGRIGYKYELGWIEFAPVGRVKVEPTPYWPGHEDKLRYQSVFFTIPQDYKGSAFLNSWPYDQTKFPARPCHKPARAQPPRSPVALGCKSKQKYHVLRERVQGRPRPGNQTRGLPERCQG